MRKFKHLDSIADNILDKLLKLDLTVLETQYVLNEIYRFNFRITNSKIKRIKNNRIDKLKDIAESLNNK
jgi:hypothetical protein